MTTWTLGAVGLRSLTIGLVALGLTACGNTPERGQGWGAFHAAFEEQFDDRKAAQDTAPGGSAAAKQARAVQSALASAEGPLMFAVMDETKRSAVLGELGRNGPYHTWRTASMQTMVFRDGILTGTRGLGYDLLSSEVSQSSALIRSRRSGQSQRVYRHLSGENHEVPTVMSCVVSPEGSDTVTFVTGRTMSATQVKETCRAEGLKVTNRYWVTGSGKIVQSIQWISPEMGKIALQTVRD